MAAFGDDHQFAQGQALRVKTHERGRHPEVSVAGNQKGGDAQVFKGCEGDVVDRGLPHAQARHRAMFQREPPLDALGVAGAVGGADFAEFGGQVIEARRADALAQSEIVRVLHPAHAGGEAERQKARRMGQREIDADRPARR